MTVTHTPIPTAAGTFGDLHVSESTARALQGMGYSTPTLIQAEAIPALREGRDVVGQAQTGTGKTAGFGIPLIESLDVAQRRVQAIVLVPTRELCLQVAEELQKLGHYARIEVIAVYGGVGFDKQTSALRRGAHVVVGTPGRVEDLIGRGLLRLDGVTFAVLDEADRMLDVGFLPAIDRILARTPRARQTSLFSATIPDEVRRLAMRHMNDPITVAVHPEQPTVEAIEQIFESVPDGNKLNALAAHLDDQSVFLALVFMRTTYRADKVVRDLSRRGYKVAALHGRRTQGQRERVLADLKNAKLQAVIATDIAARGLDITGLTHVFNYDLPDTPDTYVHRIGRTGRAGETGIAISLIGPEDHDALATLKRYLARRAGEPDTTRPATSRGSSPAPRRNSRPGTGASPRPNNPPAQVRSGESGSRSGRRPPRWGGRGDGGENRGRAAS
jgi:ATP-dependent RNA helicase DeaD